MSPRNLYVSRLVATSLAGMLIITPSVIAQTDDDGSDDTILHGEVNVLNQLPGQSSNQANRLPRTTPQMLPENAADDALHADVSSDSLNSGASSELLRSNASTDVLRSNAASDTFSLDINKFGGGLQSQSGVLQQIAPLTGMVSQQWNAPLVGGISQQQIKLLASYNIELIIDRSDSMQRVDCPGGLSRWDWAGRQAAALAGALSPYVPQGLTITTFAHGYDVYKHSNPQAVVSIFNQPNFELGTRLGEPLEERLDDYFQHHRPGDKPLLIVVITDGVPIPKRYEPELVRTELVNATKEMTDPFELTVTFLQVGGNDLYGKAYLTDLDLNLLRYGARYDIVHTKLFNTLQQIGLAQALVLAVQESRSQTKPRLDPIPFPPTNGNGFGNGGGGGGFGNGGGRFYRNNGFYPNRRPGWWQQ